MADNITKLWHKLCLIETEKVGVVIVDDDDVQILCLRASSV